MNSLIQYRQRLLEPRVKETLITMLAKNYVLRTSLRAEELQMLPISNQTRKVTLRLIYNALHRQIKCLTIQEMHWAPKIYQLLIQNTKDNLIKARMLDQGLIRKASKIFQVWILEFSQLEQAKRSGSIADSIMCRISTTHRNMNIQSWFQQQQSLVIK